MRIFIEQMLSSDGKYYKTDVATTNNFSALSFKLVELQDIKIS